MISRPSLPAAQMRFSGAGPTEAVRANASLLADRFEEFWELLGDPVILTVGSARWSEWSASKWSRALSRLRRGDLDFMDVSWIPNQRQVPYPGVSSASFGVIGLKKGYNQRMATRISAHYLVFRGELPGYPTVELDKFLSFLRRVCETVGLTGGSLVVTGQPGIDYGHGFGKGWIFGPNAWSKYLESLGWGVLLTQGHLQRLGGADHVRANAPVHAVINASGGLWLELTDSPLNVDQPAIDTFRRFLEPIIPTVDEVIEADDLLSIYEPKPLSQDP